MRTSPTSAAPHRLMRTLAAAVPLAVLLGATPGHAAPEVYYHAGAWHAFTDKDAQGTAVCGIGTQNPTDGRSLTLTYTVGGSDLTVTASKPSWKIPDNTMLEADMQIDRNEPWQAQADGHGSAAEWVISAAEIRDFDTQFRNGSALTLTFPTGNEPPWALSLSGSTAASATLWRCVQDLTDRARAAGAASTPTTQPTSQAPTSQAPTQPYAPPSASSAAPASATPAASPAPAAGGTPAPAATPAGGTPAPAPTSGTPASAPANAVPAPAAAPPASGMPAPATKP